MGNNIGKACHCLDAAGEISRRQHDFPVILSDQLDEGLGHSFRYLPPGLPRLSSSSFTSEVDGSFATTTFRSISGASVSANTSTSLSPSLKDLCSSSAIDRASSFASSTSFASSPLQLLPRYWSIAGSANSTTTKFVSGPIEEVCGKLQNGGPRYKARIESEKPRFNSIFRKLIFHIESIAAVLVKGDNNVKKPNSKKTNGNVTVRSGDNLYSRRGDAYDQESQYCMEKEKFQWAEGKAGEDRVQVVISEEHGWVFVGIYDGFNGPDATEYLLSVLYSTVHNELKDLVWNAKFEPTSILSNSIVEDDLTQTRNIDEENGMLRNADMDLHPYSNRNDQVKNSKYMGEGLGMKWKGKSQSSWTSCECDISVEPERKLTRHELSHLEADRPMGSDNIHSEVLRAMSEALRKTEDAYFEIADDNVENNPELALIGSCVLVMLMKNEDVYLMNVGDSRAVLAQEAERDDLGPRKMHLDFKQIREDTSRNHNLVDHGFGWGGLPNLVPLQLTTDHSTCVEEEVQRIRTDHPDDASAIENDRVKGYLKVTRAFGVGFLKQPKWNDALLERFRIEYVGTSPYITCLPSLYHYRLGPRDRFLILSSDGLYQYLSNEEAVSQVEYFINMYPNGDPAQHLIQQVLFQAAEKHGMELDELLDIPQGERRRYHDDVSVIVISLEGRIWRSYI
ncbi:hypothetical protein I3843_09G188400 [Carya illinoinensis]|nr:hypothetical protein I3843_09G188400 [Carya illinoinensis]